VGNFGLDPDAALHALDRLMSAGGAQASAIDIDWNVFRPVYEARRARPIVADLSGDTTPGAAAGHSAPPLEDAGLGKNGWAALLRPLPPSERGGELVGLVRAQVADTLGFDEPDSVALAANFYDIGMDSLMMAELVGRLNKRIGTSSSALVFDHPTVESLSAALLERLDLGAIVGPPQPAGVPPASIAGSETVGYQPELEDDIFRFQAQAWPHRSPHLIPARWRWMFVESAHRLGRTPIVWVHRDNGAIVGHMGAIPVALKIGSEVRETAWCVETMVLESHRSRAVGSRLMLDARETLPFALSLGQTSEMRQICLRLGWKQIAPLQVAQLLVRPENVLKGKLPGPAAWAAGLGLRAAVAARSLLHRPVHLHTREVTRFDERHDRLWRESSHDMTCAVVRDASYLNWKYVEQPGQEFVRLEVIDGDTTRAVAVWMFREPDAAYKYRRAYLVDLVAPLADEAMATQVIRAACAVPTERGADALLCMHIGQRLTRALRECGFTLRDPERFLLVDPGPLTGEALEQALSADNWFVTQGDSDIERPW
jgi:acyl carrier protein